MSQRCPKLGANNGRSAQGNYHVETTRKPATHAGTRGTEGRHHVRQGATFFNCGGSGGKLRTDDAKWFGAAATKDAHRGW